MIGILLTVLMIIAGELIWLMDPITIGRTYYWIDLLEYVIRLCVLPLCIWIIAAARGIIDDRRRLVQANQYAAHMLPSSQSSYPAWQKFKWSNDLLSLLRVIIIISAVITGILIIFAPHSLLVIGIGFSVSLLIVMTDSIVGQWLMRGRIPLKTCGQIISVIMLLIVLLFPTRYMVTYPGLTVNMHRYATVTQQNTNQVHTTGQITGVLVFERPAFPIDWLYAAIFEHYEFRRIQPQDPSLGEQLQVVRTMKYRADQIASAYAFEKVGIGAGLTYHGVRVMGMVEHSPAIGVLQAGDIIIGINHQSVQSISDLLTMMAEIKPGTQVSLDVVRQSKVVSVTTATIPAADDPERSVIGIQIADETKLDLPLDVTYRSYMLHEGGPSHGAMLALTIIDQLTPGGVIGDWHVAGTGTIQADGTIGRIGGIKQKAYIVEQAGADVFFVPFGQESAARLGATKLTIIPVKTLDDILQWLTDHTSP